MNEFSDFCFYRVWYLVVYVGLKFLFFPRLKVLTSPYQIVVEVMIELYIVHFAC